MSNITKLTIIKSLLTQLAQSTFMLSYTDFTHMKEKSSFNILMFSFFISHDMAINKVVHLETIRK